jgi:hypothetical protein
MKKAEYEKHVRAEARKIYKALTAYREQLEARHASDPLKLPPLFLLNMATEQAGRLSKLK